MVFTWAAGIFAPETSHAAYTYVAPQIFNGNEVCPDQVLAGGKVISGFTVRIVTCVKETIIMAVSNFIVPFSEYMRNTILAAMLLAVSLWGTLLATGKNTAPIRDGFVLAIKLGAVTLFTTTFVDVFDMILVTMDYLLWAVTYFIGYSNFNQFCLPQSVDPALYIWQNIDCALDVLTGGIFDPFSNHRSIYSGLIGFFVIALFSKTVGVFIGLMGFMLIAQFIMAILRAVYTFIVAYIAVAIMALVSPIFIPLILFSTTKGYFEKWLKLTIGFMLQPVFLFAYVAMLLIAFESIVYSGPVSLYRAVMGSVVDRPCYYMTSTGLRAHPPNPLGCYVTIGTRLGAIGAYSETSAANLSVNVKADEATPAGLGSLETGVLGLAGENLAPNNAWLGDIYNYLGASVFKVDVPIKTLAWNMLAAGARPPFTPPPPDPTAEIENYQLNLVFSLLIAVITTYIFWLLLDYLPYIGSGISGDVLSMPTFAGKQFAPPGESIVREIGKKLSGVVTRR